MVKMLVGFVLFGMLALFVIMKGSNSMDMSSEKHSAAAIHEPAEAASAPAVTASEAASAAR